MREDLQGTGREHINLQPSSQKAHCDPASLTIDHGDHAVLCLPAGGSSRDDLYRDCIASVRLQLSNDIAGGVSAGAPRVDQGAGVLMNTLNVVGVVIRLWGGPGTGDGGGALGPAMEADDSPWPYKRKQSSQ